MVINSVKGPGAGTEEEAANEKDKLLNYEIDDKWKDDNNEGLVVEPMLRSAIA